MKLEYKNGVRITKLRHEMTALEVAIEQYEKAAKKYYSIKNNALKLTKEKREEKLAQSLAELGTERRHLETISDVQVQLDMYREQGLKATSGTNKERVTALQNMEAEGHHPTSVLEKYMRAEGVAKPSRHHTAHHIVPGKGKHDQISISRARTHLHIHGIRINDPANGVFLVHYDKNTPHYSMPRSRGHLKYHTKEYEIYVSQKVRRLTNIDFIKTQLQVIGRLLQDNEPKDAIPHIGRL